MVTAQDLKRIFLFKHVPDAVLTQVAQAAEEVVFSPGETLATEREPANALYLIRTGTVRATREDLSTPVIFGSGESIGQVSILDGGPAGMTAVALERVDAVALRPANLAAKLGADPEAALQLYRAVARSLAGRLRRAVDAISIARDAGDS